MNSRSSRWDLKRSHSPIAAVIGAIACLAAGASASSEAHVALRSHTAADTPGVTLDGRVAASSNVPLAIALPCRNADGLAALIHQIYDPHSPQYHHYLTPKGFAAQFGPTVADYQTVERWAVANGLSVTGTSTNRLILDVAGSAATVERAFNVHLNNYAMDGKSVRLPDVKPTVPAFLAPMICGVAGLDNVEIRKPNHVAVDPSLSPMSSPGTRPGDIIAPCGGLGPESINGVYNITSLGLDGTGQTLAVFELDGYTAGDVTIYENEFGLPHATLTNVLMDGVSGAGSGTDGQVEVTLDIELMLAVAPKASVMVYEGPNTEPGLLDVYNKIATDDLASSISSSWAIGEIGLENYNPAEITSENTIFAEMASQGQSIFCASGDGGAVGGVMDPGSQPYMCGVGGTFVSYTGNTWTGETTWFDGGGGPSAVWSKPSYQAGVGYSTTMRNVPDVSLDAWAGYAVSVLGFWSQYGGTSCAAPLWAGFTGLVNQQRALNGDGALGLPMPRLYQIGGSSHYSSDFHDIADGSNNGIYLAIPGYDDATGWGSINGANLLPDLAAESINAAPAMPDSLTATGANTQVSLSWEGSLMATSYNVYRGTSSGGESSTPIATGLTSPVYVDSPLTNGTAYYYKVAALNGAGTSPKSAEATATPFLLPNAPASLAANAGISQVALTWNASASATTYNVYRGTSPGGESATPVATLLSGTAYTDPALVNGTTYYYKVAAVDYAGTSAKSNEATGTPRWPAAPSNLTAAATGPSSVALTWTSPGAPGYDVYRGLKSGGPYSLVATPSSASYTDNGAHPATYFYYAVASIAGSYTSAKSNEASTETPPSAPTSLRAVSKGAGEIDLSWSPTLGATSYVVERGTTQGGPYSPVGTANTAPTTYADTGVSDGSAYYYVVAAVDAGGAGPTSNEAATATAALPPSTLAATTAGSTEIDLAWSASNGAVSYYVLRSTRSGGPYTRIASASGTTYNNVSLSPSTSYYYVVEAVDAGGVSANSPEASAMTDSSAPAGLHARSNGSSEIDLIWSLSKGASGYTVLRGTTQGGPYNPVGSTSSLSYADTGLTDATTYYYVLQSNNGGGQSGNSNEASAMTSPVSPANVAVTAQTSYSVSLSWTSSNGATGYAVYRSLVSGRLYTRVASSVSNSLTVTGLLPSTTYYFVVTASDAGGTSPYSSEVSATTLAATPGSIHAKAVANSEIDLTWIATKGAYSYNILHSTTEGGSYTLAGTSSTPSYADTGLNSATQYYYVVQSVDNGGASPNSSEATATTFPDAPGNLTAVAVSNTQIGLTWSASTGAISYTVWKSLRSGGPYLKVTSTSLTSATVTGLIVSDTYYFVVSASDAGGMGAYSSEASAATLPSTPSTPRAKSNGSGEIDLTWTAALGATGYNVLSSTTEGGPYNLLGTVSTPSYQDTSVSAATQYYYVVQSIGIGGMSPNSGEATATAAPDAPTVTAAGASTTTISLTWTTSTGATTYSIWRSKTSGGPYVRIAATSNTAYTSTGLVTGTTYYYVVTAAGTGGVSANSAEASAQTF